MKSDLDSVFSGFSCLCSGLDSVFNGFSCLCTGLDSVFSWALSLTGTFLGNEPPC